MSACSFCRNTNGLFVGLGDGRWICGKCLPTIQVGAALPGDRIGALLQLCHPDRHYGSKLEQLATETTQWLLAMRANKKKAERR